jgi:hypothetical protein
VDYRLGVRNGVAERIISVASSEVSSPPSSAGRPQADAGSRVVRSCIDGTDSCADLYVPEATCDGKVLITVGGLGYESRKHRHSVAVAYKAKIYDSFHHF